MLIRYELNVTKQIKKSFVRRKCNTLADICFSFADMCGKLVTVEFNKNILKHRIKVFDIGVQSSWFRDMYCLLMLILIYFKNFYTWLWTFYKTLLQWVLCWADSDCSIILREKFALKRANVFLQSNHLKRLRPRGASSRIVFTVHWLNRFQISISI